MLKEGRLRPKNSGGGIAPAAIGALIEAGYWSVNAFRQFQCAGEAVLNHR
jgi:hypothetical protein